MGTTLPKRRPGRQSPAADEAYQEALSSFCNTLTEINSSLDFKVSARGWCYILEDRIGLLKGDFDAAERLINACRKDGNLPLDICAEDETRKPANLERIDDTDIDEEAGNIVYSIRWAHTNYYPFSFWDNQEFYVEMAVEKIDLKSLFSPVCENYNLALGNIKGWCDINSRAAMMRRFKKWEERGKQCVLLLCGDHDPGGLQISSFMQSNLADLSHAVFWRPDNLIIERFGLNYDFIEANNLTWIDNLETSSGGRLDDPKHNDHSKPYVQNYINKYGVRKVEANALVVRPDEGRRLCREAILKYVSKDAITDYRNRLGEEQTKVRTRVQELLAEAFGEE